MKRSTTTTIYSGLSALLLVAAAPAEAMLRCKEVVADGQKFDFGALAGPHTVVTTEFSPPSYYNTTYTLDICAPLKRKGEVPKGYECPNGSRGEFSFSFFFPFLLVPGWREGVGWEKLTKGGGTLQSAR
jgi:Autophagy-related protein 27